jgi:hypothetical protein
MVSDVGGPPLPQPGDRPFRHLPEPTSETTSHRDAEAGHALVTPKRCAHQHGKITMDSEDDKTPLGIKIPDELEGLFGDPPLLEGEDPNRYWGLLAAMIREREPQSFSEWIYLHDTVSKLWEEQRLKRASTGLMRGEMFSALMYFLRKIHTDGRVDTKQDVFLQQLQIDYHLAKSSEVEKLAFKYFSNNPKERQEVVSLLARYGITPAVLQAKAAQQNSDAIQMFEAMGARRGKERRKLRQEDERLQRRRDSDKDLKKS